MSNEDYVTARLKFRGITRLTEAQREEYVSKKLVYEKIEDKLDKEIEEHKKEIGKLEAQLKESRPIVPGAKFVHYGFGACDLQAVIEIGTDDVEQLPIYYCFACNKDFQSDMHYNYTDNDVSSKK